MRATKSSPCAAAAAAADGSRRALQLSGFQPALGSGWIVGYLCGAMVLVMLGEWLRIRRLERFPTTAVVIRERPRIRQRR